MLVVVFLFLSLMAFSEECLAEYRWNLIPSLTVSETYDTNIHFTEQGLEDSVTRVGTNLAAIYNGINIGLRGNYLIQVNMFARHPEENVINQDGNFDVDLNRWFNRLFKSGKVTITEDFTYTPELRDYYFDEMRGKISPLSNYGVRVRRTNAFRNAFGVKVEVPVRKRFNISPSYSNLLTMYQDPEFKDNITNSGELEISYIFPQDTIYGTVGVSNIREMGGETQETNSYSFLVGLRHSISLLTGLDINAGATLLDREAADNRVNLSGKASLTKRSKASTYYIGYSRSLNSVSGVSGRPTVADIVYTSITNVHSGYLTSNIGANYAMNRSIRGDAVEVNTHSFNLSGSLNYAVRKWLRSTLAVTLFRQDSDQPSVIEMQRNQISLTFTGTWN